MYIGISIKWFSITDQTGPSVYTILYTASSNKSTKITKQLKNFLKVASLLWKLLETSYISTGKSICPLPCVLCHSSCEWFKYATYCIQFSFLIIISPNQVGKILVNTFMVDHLNHRYLVLEENLSKKAHFSMWKVLSYFSKWKNSKTW